MWGRAQPSLCVTMCRCAVGSALGIPVIFGTLPRDVLRPVSSWAALTPAVWHPETESGKPGHKPVSRAGPLGPFWRSVQATWIKATFEMTPGHVWAQLGGAQGRAAPVPVWGPPPRGPPCITPVVLL